MKLHPSCPRCKAKNDETTVYLCKEDIGGCGQLFCRQCAGGLTTVRCPRCQEADFSGAVVVVGKVAPE